MLCLESRRAAARARRRALSTQGYTAPNSALCGRIFAASSFGDLIGLERTRPLSAGPGAWRCDAAALRASCSITKTEITAPSLYTGTCKALNYICHFIRAGRLPERLRRAFAASHTPSCVDRRARRGPRRRVRVLCLSKAPHKHAAVKKGDETTRAAPREIRRRRKEHHQR